LRVVTTNHDCEQSTTVKSKPANSRHESPEIGPSLLTSPQWDSVVGFGRPPLGLARSVDRLPMGKSHERVTNSRAVGVIHNPSRESPGFWENP